MNTTEKAEALKNAGYYFAMHDSKNRTFWEWREPNSTRVAWTDNKNSISHATDAAYQHYLEQQKEAQSNHPSSGEFVEIPKRCSVCGKSLKEVGNLSLWKGELYCSYNCLNEKSDKEQPALVDVPDVLVENRKREELLEAQVAKLQAENESMRKASKITLGSIGYDSLKKKNVELTNQLEKQSRININLSELNVNQNRLIDKVQREIKETLRSLKDDNSRESNIKFLTLVDVSVMLDAIQSASKEAPETTAVVTLSEDELAWLARWDYCEKEGIYAFSVPTGEMNVHIVDKMVLEIRLVDLSLHNWWSLMPEYDTPANRKAIEAKRQTLPA